MADISTSSGKSESIATGGILCAVEATFPLRLAAEDLTESLGRAVENAINLGVLMSGENRAIRERSQ